MAELIYRGVKHTGNTEPRARVAQDLTYRSVPHDGLAGAAPRPSRESSMCYRGVRYIAAAISSGVSLAGHPQKAAA